MLHTDAGGFEWLWLGLSCIVGFVIADLYLFRAFILIESRISMVIFSLVPPITAVTGWILFSETLSLKQGRQAA
ncbi:MAG: EamA family transporter [Candidatus Aegiribacteria sp.]|nr:EamA family transporter [Candidatus Aegiribacteria sp.]